MNQQIDPSAQIDPTAEFGANVCIGHGSIVGPRCVIGDRTQIRPRAIIVQDTVMGADNDVHPFCVLGGDPQDRAYTPDQRCHLEIGDANVFREFVTVSRGTAGGEPTRIGDENMFMAHAHVGHNCQVGSLVSMANSSAIAGHAVIGDRCVLSGFVTVHQFCEVGEGVMFHVHSAVGKHVPPFTLVVGGNVINGINVHGVRRMHGVKRADIDELRELYRGLFREREATPLAEAVRAAAGRELGSLARRFVGFLERALAQEGPRARGIVGGAASKMRAGAREYHTYDEGDDADPLNDTRA